MFEYIFTFPNVTVECSVTMAVWGVQWPYNAAIEFNQVNVLLFSHATHDRVHFTAAFVLTFAVQFVFIVIRSFLTQVEWLLHLVTVYYFENQFIVLTQALVKWFNFSFQSHSKVFFWDCRLQVCRLFRQIALTNAWIVRILFNKSLHIIIFPWLRIFIPMGIQIYFFIVRWLKLFNLVHNIF